jgi:hypothetical protein
MATDWASAWTKALDELEADVSEVEELLTADHRQRDNPITNAWKPPVGLGPLPLDLRPRADAILGRQIAVARSITMALGTNRKQAAVTARIETGSQGAARPAYIDCAMYRSGRRPAPVPCRPRRQLADEPPLRADEPH